MCNQVLVDRYLLPLLLIILLVLARACQERVKASLPWARAFLTIIFCGFGIVATHDTFAVYRGWVTAIDEIRSVGVPATAILGSVEFMGWTQIEASGYVNDSRIQVPGGAYKPPRPRPLPEGCDAPSAGFLDWTPAIKSIYAVFDDAETCGGEAHSRRPCITRGLRRTRIGFMTFDCRLLSRTETGDSFLRVNRSEVRAPATLRRPRRGHWAGGSPRRRES